MVTQISDVWDKIINLLSVSAYQNIEIKKEFHDRMQQVNSIWDNDISGYVSPIIEFQINAGNVPLYFNSSNTSFTNLLNDWQKNINAGLSRDIPRGLRSFNEQFLRERLKSSFLGVKIIWDNFHGFEMPVAMYVMDGGSLWVENETNELDGNIYYLGNPKEEKHTILNDNDSRTFLFRKPFDQLYKTYPTPYLVKKGTLYHVLFKEMILKKQGEMVNSAFPYQLLAAVGTAEAIKKGQGPSQTDLDNIKEKFQNVKKDYDEHPYAKGLIEAFAGDVKINELIPDYDKALNDKLTQAVDKRILASLGLIELKGFSSNREEAILNPKVLVEEVEDAVKDYVDFIQEVVEQIRERNKSKYRTNNEVEVQAHLVKAFLTDKMKELIRSIYDRGLISQQDTLENITAFKFNTQVIKRDIERKENYDLRMFPRVVQNLDNGNNDTPDDENLSDDKKGPEKVNYKNALEIKKRNQILEEKDLLNALEENIEEQLGEYLESPYTKTNYPSQLKNLPSGARNLWIRTFNTVYKDTGNEDEARQSAWSNVKKKYKKVGDKWIKKQ